MSYSTCINCGQSVRDFEEQPHGQPTKLPGHGCPDPRGDWPWNDGQHAWDEIRFDYVPLHEVTK
jgi:hypothetical protein